MADEAVWEKVAKGRAGMSWDGVVGKVLKDLLIGGNQEYMTYVLSTWRSLGVQDRSNRKDRRKGKDSAKKEDERG